MNTWNIGDVCYFVTNGHKVSSGIITSVETGFCVVKYSKSGALRLRQSKLYLTEEEAEKHVIWTPQKHYRTPYDYDY